MKPHNRPTRDALTRMRAALLDLVQAERFTEANELAAIIERIEPPTPVVGEAAGSAAGPVARTGLSESSPFPPAAAPTFLYRRGRMTRLSPVAVCASCGSTLAAHCTVHLLPCCPGSLMHGQDEGTWTSKPIGR